MDATMILLLLANVLPVLSIISADCGNMVYQAADNPSQQFGYNICNATTESQTSLCQTGFINSMDDFCLWGPSDPTSSLPLNDNQLERTVLFCTKPGHGARVIAPQVFYTLTFVKTPSYVEVYGLFDASVHLSPLNLLRDANNDVDHIDAQLDPRGTDGRGNPIGGLMFSSAFDSSNGQYVQAAEWFSITGDDIFFLRACDPNVPGSAVYCQRWDDTNLLWTRAVWQTMGGWSWNNSYKSCQGESRPLGLMVDGNGSTFTYTGQPLPTSAAFPSPSTSACTTYPHSQFFQSIPSGISAGAQVCKPTAAPVVGASQTSGRSSGSVSGSVSRTVLGSGPGSGSGSGSVSGSGSHSGTQGHVSGTLGAVGDPAFSFRSSYVSSGSSNVSSGVVGASSSPVSSTARTAAIVGSVVGALVLLALIAILVVLRRQRRRKMDGDESSIHQLILPKVDQEQLSPSSSSPFPLSRKSEMPSYPIPPSTSPAVVSTDRSRTADEPSRSSAYPLDTPVTSADSPMHLDLPPRYDDPPENNVVLAMRNSTIHSNNELGRWAAENRSYIPIELELKLRAASYLPWYNPDEIPANVWHDRYGVGHFELRTLRELYARRQNAEADESRSTHSSSRLEESPSSPQRPAKVHPTNVRVL